MKIQGHRVGGLPPASALPLSPKFWPPVWPLICDFVRKMGRSCMIGV